MIVVERNCIKADGVMSINPTNGTRLAFQPCHTDAAVVATLAVTARAFRRARIRPEADRLALLGSMAEALAARRIEPAALIVAEIGKPVTEALAEANNCVDSGRQIADPFGRRRTFRPYDGQRPWPRTGSTGHTRINQSATGMDQ